MRVLHYADDNMLSWAQPYIQLLEALRDKGCDNVIACRPMGTLSGLMRDAGFEVHTYKPKVSSIPGLALGFRDIVRAVRPNIIHTRLSSAAHIAGFWGRRLHVPVAATVDKFPRKKYYAHAVHILPCSTPVAEFMASQGVPREKMTVIHNAVNVKNYARNETARRNIRIAEGFGDNTVCFLGMGRLVDWKGFDDLLRAFAELKGEERDYRLWIAGDGPEREKLGSLAQQLGIHERVKFWGFVKNVKPLLWGADIYVHPSWGEEAFGLSLLEAMSAGLPAIASRSGGMTEILGDSYGLTFPRRDIDSLAGCMRKSIIDADALSESALRRAWDFDISAVSARTLDVYIKILHG
ncbi:MAG: glycosyltransferase family 4 protein [Synergistaceae bacterium]|nr:glycosyltransferase family 4 protein [Synergistaceae bacterium]